MSDIQPTPLLERNPVTHERYRREVFWQITVPVLVGVVILVALAALASVLGTSQETSQWADVSLIWLIVPTMFFALIFLILLAALVFGVMQLIRVLPLYARRVQDFFVKVNIQISRLDDRIVKPVLRVQAFMASVKVLGRKLKRRS